VTSVTRWLLGLAALPVAGYGGWLLLSRQDHAQVLEAAVWLVAGVVGHDVVVAGLGLLGGLLASLLPRAARAPAAVVLVVVASLTLAAVPVLGGFGDQPANATHLDRPYLAAWLGMMGVAALVVLVAAVVRSRKKEA